MYRHEVCRLLATAIDVSTVHQRVGEKCHACLLLGSCTGKYHLCSRAATVAASCECLARSREVVVRGHERA